MPNEHIASAQHEFRAYAWYVGDLTPYWTLSGAIQGEPFEGSAEIDVDVPMPGGDVEPWTFELYYQQGSLAPRADFGLDAESGMREWRLKGRGPGQKKASYHVKPRWEGQQTLEGEPLQTPWVGLFRELPDHVDEGVEVTFDGSNVEPGTYAHILDQVAGEIAVRGGQYWGERFFSLERVNHRSPIATSERYMRVEKGMGKKLVRQDGYFGRLARVLTGEEPARAIWDIDNTETLGYLHTFRYDAATARELLPGEEYGKQLKHYHPKYVRTSESGDALEHPKVGALFKKGKNGENTFKLNSESVRWGDRDDLRDELEDTLINTLERAGIPTDAPTSFVADDHFHVETTERRVELHPDPTDAIEEYREASVAAAFREMTGSGQAVTQVMADSGDEQHVEDIADEADVSVSTVYRVLDRMQGVLENENGIVRWASRKAAEEIRSILELVERTVGSATDRVARLLGVDERVFAKASGSLQEVAAKFDLEFDDTADGRLQIRVGTPTSEFKATSRPHRSQVADEIGDAWLQVGRALGEFMRADIVLQDGTTWRASSLINEYRSVFDAAPSLTHDERPGRERESVLDRLRKVQRDLDEPPA
jgi:transposase